MVRSHDVDGVQIVMPPSYHQAVDAVKAMVVDMDQSEVDRSDIKAAILDLVSEATFTFNFLESRQ